jgi:DNA-directed RNA polymerase specialized sigma24 family protein
MTPFQRKLKSLGNSKFIPYRYNNIPPQLDEKILEELVIKQKNPETRNIETRNKIVEGHMSMGLNIAARFAFKYKYYAEDIIAEMFLCLVKGVNRFCITAISEDNNITPYLTTRIHSRLSRIIEEKGMIHMPGRTFRHYVTIGSDKADKIPSQIYLAQGTTATVEVDEYEGPTNIRGQYILPETVDDHVSSEIMEILEKLTRDFIAKKIIKLRIEGYTYKEIEPIVGKSQASISIIIRDIEEKFDKIYKGA